MKQQFEELEEENARLKESLAILNEKFQKAKIKWMKSKTSETKSFKRMDFKKKCLRDDRSRHLRYTKTIVKNQLTVKLKRLNIASISNYLMK